MAEITCPKCHATFTISEEEYKSIRMQLRDQEFVTALHEREQAFEQSKLDAVKGNFGENCRNFFVEGTACYKNNRK